MNVSPEEAQASLAAIQQTRAAISARIGFFGMVGTGLVLIWRWR